MALFPSKLNNSYDVIIIGAGPGGLYAAKYAAENGASTLVLEEHKEIGLPHHCSGWIWDCAFAREIFAQPEYQRTVLQLVDKQRSFGPSGRLISDSDRAGWVVDRVEFEKVMARQAVAAGAEIEMNARVTSLIEQGDAVRGVVVETNGKKYEMPCKVVIAADGIPSMTSGFAKKSGLAEPRHMAVDVQVQFEGLTGLNPRSIDVCFGSFTNGEFCFISPIGESSAYIALGSLDQYEKARREHPILKKLMANAQPVAIFGGPFTIEANRPFRKVVKDGFMLVGDAAGYVAVQRAMITGCYAGIVAARAVKAGNVSAEGLAEYDVMRARGNVGAVAEGMREQMRKRGFTVSDDWKAIYQIPDEEIEKVMVELANSVAATAETGVDDMELVL